MSWTPTTRDALTLTLPGGEGRKVLLLAFVSSGMLPELDWALKEIVKALNRFCMGLIM